MQQKLCSRGSGSLFLERNGPGPSSRPQLPFRCPRCGEQERFRSLASLRAHLEYRHTYHTSDSNAAGSAMATSWHELSSLPTRRGQQSAVQMFHVRSLSDSRGSGYLQAYSSERRRTQSVGVGTQAEEDEEDEEVKTEDEEEGEDDDDEEEAEEGEASRNDSDLKSFTKNHHRHHNHHHFPYPPPAPLGRPLDPDPLDVPEALGRSLYPGLEAAASAAVRRRLAGVLRAADGTMQRRLARVSTELAQTDTELLCLRAHSQHLAQERQEVAERERSLSRQVDVAVMVIATLREQLNASENELERQEREVITIQNFLEAAARQETCGKVRIQHFIENLLRRIALAERLVEYYQGNDRSPHCSHYKQQNQQQPAEHGPHRITKSRSAGGQLSSSGLYDNRTPSQFFGHPPFSKPARDRERDRDREREQRDRLAQSSRLFCRPEHRDDIWNHQRRRSAGYET